MLAINKWKSSLNFHLFKRHTVRNYCDQKLEPCSSKTVSNLVQFHEFFFFLVSIRLHRRRRLALFCKNAQGSNWYIMASLKFYSNFMGVVPWWWWWWKVGGCGGGGEPNSREDGGGWNESLWNGTKLAAAAACAAAAAIVAEVVGSNLSFTMASSVFFKARRSLARRFWNQIFTWKVIIYIIICCHKIRILYSARWKWNL